MHTMLNAVRAPLTLCYLTKNVEALVKEFVDDAVLCISFEIFKSVLIAGEAWR